MANVFKKYQNFVKKPNRNAFDLSFTNNFTTNFGKLTPVFCKEVLPGDSIRIDPTFGLNFAPMTYPVQTRMKAHLHFFYVRNRTLWKDWMDFIGNTKKNLVPPYIDFGANKHLLKSGSLADYLGLPTTLVKPTGFQTSNFYVDGPRPNKNSTSRINMRDFILDPYTSYQISTFKLFEPTQEQQSNNYQYIADINYFTQGVIDNKPANYKVNNLLEVSGIIYQPQSKKYNATLFGVLPFYSLNDDWVFNEETLPMYYNPDGIKTTFKLGTYLEHDEYNFTANFNMPESFCEWLADLQWGAQSQVQAYDIKLIMLYKVDEDFNGSIDSYQVSFVSGTDEFVEAADLELRPYGTNVLPISALPFRAYEAIYNSFYRNPQNNPFIKDGVPEYNTFVTNLDGGSDSTIYDLFNRNWDDDYLTTAVQSPQQGIAPLVGVSASGEFTFQDNDGTYKAQATFGDDGETITGINIIDNRMPAGTTRALVDMVSTGISINDFRNVNALQRWLEKNMRRGLRYRDQMMSHFGANVEYDELLMPEFIGGVSNEVDVNRIINTADVGVSPLGAYGGLAQSFGGTPNKISHYADEHGFIIGILSVVPYANYSQLLPKMFTRNSVLDYYFPEFGAIGMQAITNRDIMPLQAYAYYDTAEKVNNKLSETFGYQRPWWDYISATDEVHGRFRTDFRDYLLNRVFAKEPALNPDFLTINAKDLNDVFSVIGENPDDADNDKILGIIHFKFTKKTTIPEYGIPQLEVQ